MKNYKLFIQFVKIYFLTVLLFTLGRLALIGSIYESIRGTFAKGELWYAVELGIRFDQLVTGYILMAPILIACLLRIFRVRNGSIAWNSLFYFIFLSFSVSYLVMMVDMIYFFHFSSRMTAIVLTWASSFSIVINTILSEPLYCLGVVIYVLGVFGFYKLLKRLWRPIQEDSSSSNTGINIVLSIVLLGLVFVGIRGLQSRPLGAKASVFSKNLVINQISINPNYTFFKSVLDKYGINGYKYRLNLMSDREAVNNMQGYLNVHSVDSLNPLLRSVSGVGTAEVNVNTPNVVIVLMERGAAFKMNRHNPSLDLTPFLDSLSYEGYYFENTYSAGTRTHNGMFGTLFSHPALFLSHPMEGMHIPELNGISNTLKQNDFQTMYFSTHRGWFDNAEPFMLKNGFDLFIDDRHYPEEAQRGVWGVPDDYMFEYAVPVLTDLSKEGKPFFAVLQTTSDHEPFYMPEYFQPNASIEKEQMVEYTDWARAKLIHLAAQQTWFDNTLFVFVGDHGVPNHRVNSLYPMPLEFNHISMLFYGPGIIKEPKTFSKMASQMDIYPTVMGLLNIPYYNNTLGINLLAEDRPYACFTGVSDEHGVIDNEWFLAMKDKDILGLYRYRTNDTTNYVNKEPVRVEAMRKYGMSHLQASQYILSLN